MNNLNFDILAFLWKTLASGLILSVLTALLAILSPILYRRRNAKFIYYTWVMVAAAFILVLILPRFDLSVVHPASFPHQEINIYRMSDFPERVWMDQYNFFSAYDLWFIIYLAGASVTLLFRIVRHIQFLSSIKRWKHQEKNPHLITALNRIMDEKKICKVIGLARCECITTPMMVGHFSPTILLPIREYSPAEFSLIVQHELTHFQRRDIWSKTLVFLAGVLHWFNPAVYLMQRNLSLWCELSCDEAVLWNSDIETRKQYSSIIIGIMGERLSRTTTMSTSFYSGIRGIKTRMLSIMDTTRKTPGIAGFGFTIAFVVLISFFSVGKSVDYYDVQHQNNYQQNTSLYVDEPIENYGGFLGTIEVHYSIDGMEPEYMGLSAYEVFVLYGVDPNNQKALDAFIYSRLRTMSVMSDGTDIKGKGLQYSFTIPEGITQVDTDVFKSIKA